MSIGVNGRATAEENSPKLHLLIGNFRVFSAAFKAPEKVSLGLFTGG